MRILILAPHTDDGEFGCGGSISKFLRMGHDVNYVAFSSSENSVPPEYPSNILKMEVKEATNILGIPENNLKVLDFITRDFPLHRQKILEAMVKLQVELNPDIIMLPSTTDTHQDHQVVALEGFRAFKKTTILGYEAPANNLTFTTNAFIQLEEQDIEIKIKSLSRYKSQAHRSVSNPEFIRSLAKVRGVQIGVQYAEAFEAIRWIMR